MPVRIGNHRIDYTDPGYQISRVRVSKKAGEEYESDHAYFATLEGAAKAVLERMMGDNLRADRENVETMRDLIVAVVDARDEVCEAIKAGGLVA
ncbi:hypothetical protein DFW101_3542 [Solidesulfovibrio carbinoliphilus subsp. oakridgensis]|uniref:Uncharacterized protein n=1 Tax=Solidesulfovibrio carbinoliphilus subsp. oakridgensis TaxID=694327 RepID=G7QC92_9BACT|nr:hypothetical protein [Solidesulfovibrio carbinoliphilus]EHJ49538.1 hypothetical protein DFW101_3542 [Solidesulfovibrio carbinoliphilus subsp. oakridgensis]